MKSTVKEIENQIEKSKEAERVFFDELSSLTEMIKPYFDKSFSKDEIENLTIDETFGEITVDVESTDNETYYKMYQCSIDTVFNFIREKGVVTKKDIMSNVL